MQEEEIITEIVDSLGLASEEELTSTMANCFKAVDEGLIEYDEAISIGLLEAEDVVEKIGLEKAVAEDVLTEDEAEQWKKEEQQLKGVVSHV